MRLKNRHVVIIGGSSGIGKAVAKQSIEEGAIVTIASRSIEKLQTAKEELDDKVAIKTVDLLNEDSIKTFFLEVGQFDHLQLPGSELKFGNLESLTIDEAKHSFNSKFWGIATAIKYATPYIAENGSITTYSGAASQRPNKNTTILTPLNAAVEGLSKALSISLTPIRVNTISPGLTKTPIYSNMSPDDLKNMVNNLGDNLLVKRFAQPEEIAKAAIYLMENSYVTGTIQIIDGGVSVT